MNKVIAILLVAGIALQCVAKLGVVAWFEYNRDYIAKNLCENKDKPQMKCRGKCYLQKQLKAVDDGTDGTKNIPSKTEKQELVIFLVPAQLQYRIPYTFRAEKDQNPGRQHLNGYDPLLSVFRPPSCLG